jgi:hypothetical protein
VVAVLPRQLLAQDRILALQFLQLQNARHQHRNFLRIAGLHDVFLRAFFHRLNRSIDGCVGRNNNDRRFRADAVDLHHGLDTIHTAGHFQIHKADGIVR